MNLDVVTETREFCFLDKCVADCKMAETHIQQQQSKTPDECRYYLKLFEGG